MNVASFFSGIGGFDLGLEKAGCHIVFQCEINKFDQQVLIKHWPNVPKHDDIKTLTPDNIPNSDIWCAGFPCQDVSLANNGKREGLNGKRSGLFHTFAELVQQRYPRWILLENVPGLLSSQKGEDFRTIISKLDELGYGVAWRVFDAKFFGTPQRRRRVFIVASHQSICSSKVLFDDSRASITCQTYTRSSENASSRPRESNSESNTYAIQNAAIGRVHTSGPQAKGYRCDGETWTFDSRGRADAVCSPTDAFGIREVPGIPRGLDHARYTSLGNAVNMIVVEWIGRGIKEIDELHYGQERTFQSESLLSTIKSSETDFVIS